MIQDFSILNTVLATHADVVVATNGLTTITGIDRAFYKNQVVSCTTTTGVGVTTLSTTATTAGLSGTAGTLDAGTALTAGRVYRVVITGTTYYAYAVSLVAGTNWNVIYLGPNGGAPNTASTVAVYYYGDGSVKITPTAANSTGYAANIQYFDPTIKTMNVINWTYTSDASATALEIGTNLSSSISTLLNAAGYYVGLSAASGYVVIMTPTTLPLKAVQITNTTYTGTLTIAQTAEVSLNNYGANLIPPYGFYPVASSSTANDGVVSTNRYSSATFNLAFADPSGKQQAYQVVLLVNDGDSNAAALMSYIASTFQ